MRYVVFTIGNYRNIFNIIGFQIAYSIYLVNQLTIIKNEDLC